MNINQAPVTKSFPVLLQCLERPDASMDEILAPTDIWTCTYQQGETPESDRLSDWKCLAGHEGVYEDSPCYAPTGRAAYIRKDRKKPGLYLVGDARPVVAGSLWTADFSPDRKHLSFADKDGLWISQPDGTDRRQVATGHVNDVKFGPDGALWYAADGRLFRREHGASNFQAVPTKFDVAEFALSPNGKSVAYTRSDSLRVLSLKSGSEKTIAQMDSYDAIHYLASPVFSPDGKRVLFTHVQTNLENYEPWTNAELWVVSSGGGEPALVEFSDMLITGIARAA